MTQNELSSTTGLYPHFNCALDNKTKQNKFNLI